MSTYTDMLSGLGMESPSPFQTNFNADSMQYGSQGVTPDFQSQGISATDLAYSPTGSMGDIGSIGGGASGGIFGDLFGGMSGGDAMSGMNSLFGFGTSIAGLAQNAKQMNMAKDMYQGTLDMANEQNRLQAQTYNTNLSDRQASRSSGLSTDEMNRYYGEDYVDKNALTPEKIGG